MDSLGLQAGLAGELAEHLRWLGGAGTRELPGKVDVKPLPGTDLVLLDYRRDAQFQKPAEWTPLERVSRGLIINTGTGEIVARPFDKFWNWGEHEALPDTKPAEVSRKEDGSLGILYRTPYAPFGLRIATRGSFDSEQAVFGSHWVFENITTRGVSIPPELTLLFEIIYPENRIVVDYGDFRGLVLIGARNRFTGEDYLLTDIARMDFVKKLPAPVVDIILRNPENMERVLSYYKAAGEGESKLVEGFVVRMDDGTRFKMKFADYLELHRFVSAFSFKRVRDALRDGKLAEVQAVCPDHYRARLDGYVEHIERAVDFNHKAVLQAFVTIVASIPLEIQHNGPDKEWRKRFAQGVASWVPNYKRHLFNMADVKYKRADLYDDVEEPSDTETKQD